MRRAIQLLSKLTAAAKAPDILYGALKAGLERPAPPPLRRHRESCKVLEKFCADGHEPGCCQSELETESLNTREGKSTKLFGKSALPEVG